MVPGGINKDARTLLRRHETDLQSNEFRTEWFQLDHFRASKRVNLPHETTLRVGL